MDNDFLSKTLVTGASGMVGAYVDFGYRPKRQALDITNLSQVLEVCRAFRPKAILHLAANVDVDGCERNPVNAYWVNSIGTYNMAVAAKELDIKLAYVSTVMVFDGTKKTPYTEEDMPNPQNIYGRSKYVGELIIKGMLKNFLIVRTGWLFGGDPLQGTKFVAKIIQQLNQPEIKAVNDKFGSPTYAKDLIGRIKDMIQKDVRGTFHLASQGQCSRYEIAKEILRLTKSKGKIIPVSSGAFQLDARRGYLEALTSSAAPPIRPWQEALREYVLEECKLA